MPHDTPVAAVCNMRQYKKVPASRLQEGKQELYLIVQYHSLCEWYKRLKAIQGYTKLKARIESSVNVRGRITATQKFLRRFNSAYLYETADGEGNTATISIFNNIDAP